MEDRLHNIETLVSETRAEVKEMTKAMATLVIQEHRLQAVEKSIIDIKENKREMWKEIHGVKEECIAWRATQDGAKNAPQTPREVIDSIVSGAASHGMWIVIATCIGLALAKWVK